MSKIFVTGAAGFIGYHLCCRLANDGHEILGIDNLNNYYDPKLKLGRLERLESLDNFSFKKMDLCDETLKETLFAFKPKIVINLAAQAGVRYSLENPNTYLESNINGFVNLLEAVRHIDVEHMLYASSSSVYGKNSKVPFSTHDRVDHPVSLYAATKKANELIAHTYAHLYRIPLTGLRFFTVYGSWGRPDMAYFSFTEKILKGENINIFNNGDLKRDFTHITDIVESVCRLIDIYPTKDPASGAPMKVYNIGASSPIVLGEFIETLEKLLNRTAKKTYLPMQPGDVEVTYADVEELEKVTQYKPRVTLAEGLKEFVDWFLSYNF